MGDFRAVLDNQCIEIIGKWGAWKAAVLPLNYTRKPLFLQGKQHRSNKDVRHTVRHFVRQAFRRAFSMGAV